MWEFSFNWRGRPVLLVRPNQIAIGHLAYETKYAIATAALHGARLYLIRAPKSVNTAVFHLEAPGIDWLRNRRGIDLSLNLWIGLSGGWVRWRTEREMARRQRRRRRHRDPRWRDAVSRRRKLGLNPEAVWAERELKLRTGLRIGLARTGEQLATTLLNGPLARLLHGRLRKRMLTARQRARHVQKEARRTPCRPSLVEALAALPDSLPSIALPERPVRVLPPGDKLYCRRDLMMEPHFARCSEEMRRRGQSLAAELGVPAQAPVVTVHARTTGFKGHRDILIKERLDQPDHVRDESARNADITNYLRAIDWLVEQGYTVVRLGDSSMPPITRAGVVDIATSPHYEPLLDFYFVGRSHFMMCSDSGPGVLAWLMGVPLVYLNAAHPSVCWPFGPYDLVVPKYVRERASGRFLRLEEMLEGAPVTHFKDTRLFDYVELTPADVLTAVGELLARLGSAAPPEETELQRRFREGSIRMMQAPDRTSFFHKWGCRSGVLGAGTIARFVVERNAMGTWSPAADENVSFSGEALR